MAETNTAQATGPLLTYAETAGRFGIAIDRLRWLVHRRRIPHVRLGPRSVFFREREVLEWIDRHAVPARPGGQRAAQ